MNIPASTFAHRYPNNGKVESICLKCLLTVCSCRGVEQMIQEEAYLSLQAISAAAGKPVKDDFASDYSFAGVMENSAA